MRSAVAFTNTRRLFGNDVSMVSSKNASNIIYGMKRIIGRLFDDPHVQAEMKLWPFSVTNRHGRPVVNVTNQGTVQQFSPHHISSMILEEVKANAERLLGVEVKNAVITVPSTFNYA